MKQIIKVDDSEIILSFLESILCENSRIVSALLAVPPFVFVDEHIETKRSLHIKFSNIMKTNEQHLELEQRGCASPLWCVTYVYAGLKLETIKHKNKKHYINCFISRFVDQFNGLLLK